jgi:hypothetical protein
MKSIKTMGLLLVAVCALGALVATSALASATPEFYTKAAVNTSSGNIPYTTTSATAFLEGKTSGLKVECKTSTGTGEADSATSNAKVITLYKSCEIAGLALPCENKGASTKEIETKSLKGELGAITTALPGIRLSPESGTYVAEFECAGGGVLIKAKGSLIGSLTGASGETVAEGKLPASAKLTLKATKGVQFYTHFLTGPSEQLTSVVSEFSSEKGEYVTHEELGAQSQVSTIKSVHASDLGFTK